jgi:LuxR family transcriptional regulator of csgAB operon
MRSKKISKKTGTESIPNVFINIVGQNMLQNKLLLSFLNKQTGLKGTCFRNLESIIESDSIRSSIPHLFILDCKHMDMKNLWTSIHKCDFSNCSQCFFVLCNAEPASGIETNAMDNGIRGIFYHNDSLPLISKGIRAVLNGDIWYSRKTLNKLIIEKRSSSNVSSNPAVYCLTGREKQVLSCISSGYTNKDVANEFNISMHTVKTHIYNIYGKINVTNRLQATLWATKHF